MGWFISIESVASSYKALMEFVYLNPFVVAETMSINFIKYSFRIDVNILCGIEFQNIIFYTLLCKKKKSIEKLKKNE